MAYYLVRAEPRDDVQADLKTNLAEGTFEEIRPFGEALTYSLKHARVMGDGTVVWEEEDYCVPPLKEERAAVLDRYFKNIRVEKVENGEGWQRISRIPFLFPDLNGA